ncbi:FxLYD domain-containing protein [Diplocloster agilis]|uniref:FxLYD domain-containing protein n=1 Tax=Diplocloster agilis TaxID=2850323 RepID=UPI00130EFAF9|nr:FxLYD domain-containing protein [Suonthocola fibrivorans]MCU6733168.1 FxLYD domain-containing protein [Suonthocola fibrivorans]
MNISDLKWDNNSSYYVCTGKVKNNGSNTYYYITVKGSFKDAKGNVLDSDLTYAVGSEGLAPGEASSFRLSVEKDYRLTDCSVRLMDFEK